MKRILLYGDSNTWGYDPRTEGRYDETTRWAGVLARTLGAGYTIIEEGLNGRTTVLDDPLGEGKNGKTYLGPCLDSHWPLDVVVLMLGTNDLKHRFGLSAFDIAKGVRVLVETILTRGAGLEGGLPKLLLLSPPHLNPQGLGESFAGGVEKSHGLAACYEEVARELGCEFFDVATLIGSSPVDGVHWERNAHKRVGLELAQRVRSMFGDEGGSAEAEAPTPAEPAFEPDAKPSDSNNISNNGSNSVITTSPDPKIKAMRESVGKLLDALSARGKRERAEETLQAHDFDPDTATDLEKGRRVYAALRDLLKE